MTESTLHRGTTVALHALFLMTLAPLSACAATHAACADAPIYLMDNTTLTSIDRGARLDWDDRHGVVLSAKPVPSDLGDYSWANFDPVPGASSYVSFLAEPGAERTPSGWKQWGDAGPVDSGVQLPAVWPGHLGEGAPADVKRAGGTYSMGIALTDGTAMASVHVIRVYYTTIHVDANTGTWTFSDPVVCTSSTGRASS